MKLKRLFGYAATALISIVASLALLGLIAIFVMQSKLPSVSELKDMHMQVPTRIYDKSGGLIAQYGYNRRLPVSIKEIPQPLINAVLATEDARYYSHSGVDFIGIARAAVAVLSSGKKVQGASTITMQVARNFFLSRKKTYARKLNEILLAIKIDHALSKDKVLELYLNKIYFGHRAYGVAGAAQVYYGKKLSELTLPEMAMIAGLPQAPSRVNPLSNPDLALIRRNHVLHRMLDVGFINNQEYKLAIQAPITAKYHKEVIAVKAYYFAEWIHQQLLKQYGDKLDELGLQVTTTIDEKLQNAANQSLEAGLDGYTKRHGYVGPIKHAVGVDEQLTAVQQHDAWLHAMDNIHAVNQLDVAVITRVNSKSVDILLADDTESTINWSGLSWASKALKDGFVGKKPSQASNIVKVGDVVWVTKQGSSWSLSQYPVVQGALVSLDPSNGSIIAMSGGYDYTISKFNRATQAKRQSGSNFKPFIYSAALAKGYTLASIINDAPVVMKDSGENELWRPQNDTLTFNGPTRLRVGLTKSRNLVSIRLLQDITIPYAIKYLAKFGFNKDELPHSLSLALGSSGSSPLQLATGYAVVANGGYRVAPYGVASIKDQTGSIIFKASPATACEKCSVARDVDENDMPAVLAPQVITPQNAYLMTQALQGVVQTGTARRAKSLNRTDLAGKTGTTNNQVDAWFSGFNQKLVTTVWVGFDDMTSLHEYGSGAALPIWIDFTKIALGGTPLASMQEPTGIIQVKINPEDGLLASSDQKNAMFESFSQNTVPTKYSTSNNYLDSAGGDTSTNNPLF